MNAPNAANAANATRHALFSVGELQAWELVPRDVPMLQSFFSANPDYFIAVNGDRPRDDEAQQEFDELPPASMPFDKRRMIGFIDPGGGLVAMASVLSNFLAARVWHVGLFMVASSAHGSGLSRSLYESMQDWMARSGASWIRLCAVAGNHKAERFWEKLGYTEVRRHLGVPTGRLTSTIRVFVKPLCGGAWSEYFGLVPRDDSNSTLA